MTKEELIDQFSTCYDQNGWFVAVRNAIDGVNVEEAAWKPSENVNCIWEMLSHLNYYNNAYLQRFRGVDFEYDVESNDETFSVGEYDEDAWQADIERFDTVMTEWLAALELTDKSKFAELVPNKEDTTWAELVGLISTHNAYHAGQILLLRKLHGTWDPQHGVS